jgi:high-affinity K+ transport system ATPase subunit B
MPLYLATVDEAAITGASAPFVRESGGETTRRNAVSRQ